jgi:hypothetical protein
MRRKRWWVWLSIFCFLGILILAGEGLAGSARSRPDFKTLGSGFTALVVSDVKIYELSAGGLAEQRDDWCELGRKNLLDAISQACKGKGLEVKEISGEDALEEELDDIRALYRAVSASIRLHTYGPFAFPDKLKNFDYSVGPVDEILKRHGADYLLFVFGQDSVSTSGRKALAVAQALLAGVHAGWGLTHFTAGVADPSGNIVWYNGFLSEGAYDLRNAADDEKIVTSVFSELPETAK